MQRIKLDPISYVLLLGILGLQIYATFLSSSESDKVLTYNEEAYQRVVFDDPENKGVMHQVFRQNEVDRELLKAILSRCGR